MNRSPGPWVEAGHGGDTLPPDSNPPDDEINMFLSRNILILLLAFLVAAPLSANEAIEKRMAEVVPGLSPDSIRPMDMDGVFEVRYGTDIFYVSEDGRFLIQGSLIDLEARENLTEKTRRGIRSEIFAGIPDAELTVYVPDGEVRHTINVFTDPNCPYCRRQHEEMLAYLDAGVKVRYFMFPVLGRDSPSVMNNVWCSDSRTDAMDRAKAGLPVAAADCATPLDAHMSLGRELGINGTPATVTANGQQISGYRPVAEMLQLLAAE
jgi:thiol:disulfide interchange protein DsbC